MERNIIKTVEADNLLGEVSDLIYQAEVEESVRTEEKKDSNLRKRRIINGLIKGTDTYDRFKEIVDEEWPSECFTKSTVRLGECPVREGDTVLWRSVKEVERETGAARLWKESLPELSEMSGGCWETLVMKSKRISRGREEREWVRRVHVNQEAEGQELFEKLKELRDLLKELEVDNIVMALEDDMEVEVVTKMLECIMRGAGIHTTLYSMKAVEEELLLEKPRGHQGNAIVVRAKDGNYADTLKTVKKDLTKEGQKLTVKKIRSTRGGEMLIELNEGDDGAKIEEILNKREEFEVRILDKDRGSVKRFVIRDLDAVKTVDEIEEVLRDTAESKREEEAVEVLSLREAYDNTQTAIVQMTGEHGMRISQKGGVKLGLVQVRVEEWVEVVRCFRCWGYGHRAMNCDGPDRSRHCLRYGIEGHNTRECLEEEAFCPICQRKGHRAGSGRCPRMRDLLEKIRKQKEDRRGRKSR